MHSNRMKGLHIILNSTVIKRLDPVELINRCHQHHESTILYKPHLNVSRLQHCFTQKKKRYLKTTSSRQENKWSSFTWEPF